MNLSTKDYCNLVSQISIQYDEKHSIYSEKKIKKGASLQDIWRFKISKTEIENLFYL